MGARSAAVAKSSGAVGGGRGIEAEEVGIGFLGRLEFWGPGKLRLLRCEEERLFGRSLRRGYCR